MKRFLAPLLPVIPILLLGASLSADTLLLRDGRRIEGQLISVQNGVVEFDDVRQVTGSRAVRLGRDVVLGIEFDRNDRNTTGYPAPPDSFGGRRGGGRPSGLRERQVMVGATVRSVDTNIDVQAGQDVYFEASGEIHWGPNRRNGPEGEANSPFNANRPLPNRQAAALIGRVGQSASDAFFIGADRGPIRMRSSGRLFLGVNDDVLEDNSGAFRVIVYY